MPTRQQISIKFSQITELIHSCLITQTPMYNVNRIMRNAGEKGRVGHL